MGFGYGVESSEQGTVAPQGSQEHLVNLMEERMIEVEQKLKLVKRLLQEKVNQLQEQVKVCATKPDNLTSIPRTHVVD
nr:ninein-like [Meriones unguiculatus]